MDRGQNSWLNIMAERWGRARWVPLGDEKKMTFRGCGLKGMADTRVPQLLAGRPGTLTAPPQNTGD